MLPIGVSEILTILPARNSGFLCVISDLSTFRNPAVTFPLFNSPNKDCDKFPFDWSTVFCSTLGVGVAAGATAIK